MAPVEPEALSHHNTTPILLFSSQLFAIGGLTAYILRDIWRASNTLSPSTSTRSQISLRRRHVTLFATLAALSLASVTTFSVAWRVLSYLAWAEDNRYDGPPTLWSGWYGTAEEGVGSWRLGDWLRDVDLRGTANMVGLGSPEGFAWTSQQYVGLIASALFMGVEGYRRNLPAKLIAAFLGLSQLSSLGFALNLFFITMLYTPAPYRRSSSSQRDTLFTPKSFMYSVPIIGALGLFHYVPTLLARGEHTTLAGIVLGLLPFYLAFAPKIVPESLGRHHETKTSAHRSFAKTFYLMGLTSFALFWKQLATSFMSNTPARHDSVYDRIFHPDQQYSDTERVFQGLRNAIHKLRVISSDPVISVSSSDLMFTIISLCAWAFVRNLSVDDMLDCSVLSFLSGSPKTDKHVAFKEESAAKPKLLPVHDAVPGVITPVKRGRGRPRKNAETPVPAAATTASSSASLRRSIRRSTRYGEDAYEPPAQVGEEIAHTEMDAATTHDDVVAGGESAALGLFLTFVGGVGQLAASVLGGEVAASSAGGD